MAFESRPRMGKTRRATRSRSWSRAVTIHSNALDLEKGLFIKRSPREVALSLKRSAEASKKRKGTPFQSAMSMLNFYMNRAGRNLSQTRRQVLERARTELRVVFGRSEG
jgi:hypothetical protein